MILITIKEMSYMLEEFIYRKLFKLKKFLIYALQYGDFEIKIKLLLKYLFFVCFKIA